MKEKDLEMLNDFIFNYRIEIEISKNPNEELSIISLYKPKNLSREAENLMTLNINKTTLSQLLYNESQVFGNNSVENKLAPNNIHNFIIKDFRIVIKKDIYSTNISAKIYKSKDVINEILSPNLTTLMENLNLFCSSFLGNEFNDYCTLLS